MAYLRKGMGDNHPHIGSGRFSALLSKTLRWAAVPCVGIAVISLSAATLASLHSAAALSGMEKSGSAIFLQKSAPDAGQIRISAQAGKTAMRASLGATQQFSHFTRTAPTTAASAKASDPFASVIAEARLTRDKLHAAFADAGMEIASLGNETALLAETAMPSAERFFRMEQAESPANEAAGTPLSGPLVGPTGLNVELAYVEAASIPENPVQLALAPLSLDPLDTPDEDDLTNEMLSGQALPDQVAVLPLAKPAIARQLQDVVGKPDSPSRKPGNSSREEAQQALAYARPDKPEVGAFKNLFNTPKAGNGVAVYDISAAVVHMPDGTKLEAHSGIGKMIDNPRYVHVKMNGPTPPNTYKLSMREKRFHGVEAVRMTPIGKETMHGRNGILAHSYLLRGGRVGSHGCVSFKDYNRFLKAFKQGKVTHIVVVPNLSKVSKVQLASIRRDR